MRAWSRRRRLAYAIAAAACGIGYVILLPSGSLALLVPGLLSFFGMAAYYLVLTRESPTAYQFWVILTAADSPRCH